jgi:hypothetical protein
MTDEDINYWSESLRTRLEFSSAIAGTVYGVITLLMFGPMISGGSEDWGIVHLFFSILGPLIFSLFVYHSILFRQLALPGAIVGIIYSCLHFQGKDLYLYLNLFCLVVFIMIVIGIIEARATTGKYPDFWRSYLFHPLGWATHFKIKTHID